MKISRIVESHGPRLAGIIAVLSFGLVSTALAVPPFHDSFGGSVVEELVVECDGFDVLSNYSYQGSLTEFYDRDGVPTRLNIHWSYYDVVYFNSLNPEVFLTGGPGENANDRYSGWDPDIEDYTVVESSGMLFRITVPGYGVIFRQGGRFVIDLNTFEFIFQAGPNDFFGGESDALCAALTE